MKTKYYWEVGSRTVLVDKAGEHLRYWQSTTEPNILPNHCYPTDIYKPFVPAPLKLGQQGVAEEITYGQFIMWFSGFINDPREHKSHVD